MVNKCTKSEVGLYYKSLRGTYHVASSTEVCGFAQARIFKLLDCSKSCESDIYRAVEEPKFLRHFKISSVI